MFQLWKPPKVECDFSGSLWIYRWQLFTQHLKKFEAQEYPESGWWLLLDGKHIQVRMIPGLKKGTVFIWFGFAMPQDSTLTLPPKRMVWTSRGDNGAFAWENPTMSVEAPFSETRPWKTKAGGRCSTHCRQADDSPTQSQQVRWVRWPLAQDKKLDPRKGEMGEVGLKTQKTTLWAGQAAGMCWASASPSCEILGGQWEPRAGARPSHLGN